MHIINVPKCTFAMCPNAHLQCAKMHVCDVPKCTLATFKMCICTLVDMHNCAFVDMCICAPELASLWMGKVVCSPQHGRVKSLFYMLPSTLSNCINYIVGDDALGIPQYMADTLVTINLNGTHFKIQYEQTIIGKKYDSN